MIIGKYSGEVFYSINNTVVEKHKHFCQFYEEKPIDDGMKVREDIFC